MLANLCLTECLFKVVLHSQILNLFSVIAYSLQITELTPQVCILLKLLLCFLVKRKKNILDT